MDKDFKALGINEELIGALDKQGITVPSIVQADVIPLFLDGKDLIIQSETGSGKTLSYLLPIFSMVDTSLRSTQFIILTPTHELAVQVHKQAEFLSDNTDGSVRSALIIGGANISRQIDKLKEKPQIVIGSTGRILDLIKKKKISAHTVKAIILDEGDRMLDDLNIDDVKSVIKTTLKQRQIVVLSASIGEKTISACKEIMKEPCVLQVTEANSMPENIEHYYILCDRREKINYIRKIVHGQNVKKTIVFINNQENIEVTVDKLNYHGLKAVGIYGAAHKSERRQAMDAFRDGKAEILVSSDIGARGLDIPGVTHIINLDIPEEPVYYLHRAGRTGRMMAKGIVISLATFGEKKWLMKYEKAYNIKLIQKDMSFGNLIDTNKKIEISAKKEYERKSRGNNKITVNKKDKDNKKDIKQDQGFFARKAEKKAQKQKNNNK